LEWKHPGVVDDDVDVGRHDHHGDDHEAGDPSEDAHEHRNTDRDLHDRNSDFAQRTER
jgi:hypothetical protein